jgi:hypothetical protein
MIAALGLEPRTHGDIQSELTGKMNDAGIYDGAVSEAELLLRAGRRPCTNHFETALRLNRKEEIKNGCGAGVAHGLSSAL